MKQLKKFLAMFFSVTIAAGLLTCIANAEKADIPIGKLVYFGSYNNGRMVYEVVGKEDVNGDGVQEYLLLSRYVVSYRAFDPESLSWKDSSLRAWLQSDKQTVTWAGKAPSAANGVATHPYDTDAGFMQAMTMNEKEMITPVTHDGVTDTVFLLSREEYEKYAVTNMMPGTWATATGGDNKLFDGRCGWARNTTKAGDQIYCRFYNSGQFAFAGYASNDGRIGVRPAVYITASVGIKSGNGDTASPYTLEYIDEDENIGKYVSIGRYNGGSVIYEIVGKHDADGDGAKEYLLLGRHVISYRAFDPESLSWKDSALRAWLQSDADTVTWAGKAPSAANGITTHPYDTDAGFLSGMSAAEKNLIKPVMHDGVTDTVFILSRDEYETYAVTNAMPGRWGTATGADAMQYGGRCSWARNTTAADNQIYYRYYNSGSIGFVGGDPKLGNIGVRTAMYISAEIAPVSGDGSLNSPYRLTGHSLGEITADETAVSVTYDNPTGSSLHYALMVAVYHNGRLKEIDMANGIQPYSEGKLSVPAKTYGEGDTVKAFVWNMDTLTPIDVLQIK